MILITAPIIEESTEPCLAAPLAALLEHPEFVQGLTDAHGEFLGSYEAIPLTEEEMIEEVEMNLGFAITQRSRKLSHVFGWEPSSYMYNLGFVIGTINEGLTYAEKSL